MSRSLISMRPRRQIPAGAGAEPGTGCSAGSLRDKEGSGTRWRIPRGTHGGRRAWGSSGRRTGRRWQGPPAAGSRAGSCSAPRSPPTSHCRAPPRSNPPRAARSALPTRVQAGLAAWAPRWPRGRAQGSPRRGCGWPRLCPRVSPAGGAHTRERGTKPCGVPRDVPSFPPGFTSAEGFVAQPAAAAVPALAPLQLLVPPLAAPQADGSRARPVSVQVCWGRRGEGTIASSCSARRAPRGRCWSPQKPIPALAAVTSAATHTSAPASPVPSLGLAPYWAGLVPAALGHPTNPLIPKAPVTFWVLAGHERGQHGEEEEAQCHHLPSSLRPSNHRPLPLC